MSRPYVGAMRPQLVLRHFGLVWRTFFWHFKSANACFFSKVYTTMKFQLVSRKFQLVCTLIPERCDWSVQTHWSEGAHVCLRPQPLDYLCTERSKSPSNMCPQTYLPTQIQVSTFNPFISTMILTKKYWGVYKWHPLKSNKIGREESVING